MAKGGVGLDAQSAARINIAQAEQANQSQPYKIKSGDNPTKIAAECLEQLQGSKPNADEVKDFYYGRGRFEGNGFKQMNQALHNDAKRLKLGKTYQLNLPKVDKYTGDTHLVKGGDTLSAICRENYGKANKEIYEQLRAQNPGAIDENYGIKKGKTLRLPKLAQADAVVPQALKDGREERQISADVAKGLAGSKNLQAGEAANSLTNLLSANKKLSPDKEPATGRAAIDEWATSPRKSLEGLQKLLGKDSPLGENRGDVIADYGAKEFADQIDRRFRGDDQEKAFGALFEASGLDADQAKGLAKVQSKLDETLKSAGDYRIASKALEGCSDKQLEEMAETLKQFRPEQFEKFAKLVNDNRATTEPISSKDSSEAFKQIRNPALSDNLLKLFNVPLDIKEEVDSTPEPQTYPILKGAKKTAAQFKKKLADPKTALQGSEKVLEEIRALGVDGAKQVAENYKGGKAKLERDMTKAGLHKAGDMQLVNAYLSGDATAAGKAELKQWSHDGRLPLDKLDKLLAKDSAIQDPAAALDAYGPAKMADELTSRYTRGQEDRALATMYQAYGLTDKEAQGLITMRRELNEWVVDNGDYKAASKALAGHTPERMGKMQAAFKKMFPGDYAKFKEKVDSNKTKTEGIYKHTGGRGYTYSEKQSPNEAISNSLKAMFGVEAKATE